MPRFHATVRGGRWRTVGVRVGAALVAGCAGAGSAGAQVLVVVPEVSVTATVTSNRELVPSERQQSDQITTIAPGLSVSSRRGALQGGLRYSLNGLVYANASSLNSTFHTLASNLRFAPVDSRFGLEATATAGRQTLSAYGAQTSDPTVGQANQVQTYGYSLSPYLSGIALGDLAYQVKANYTTSRSNAAAASAGNTASLELTAGLVGKLGALAWSLDATRLISESGDLPRSHNGRITASTTWAPDVEVGLTARLGSEVEDLMTGTSQRHTIWGASVLWTPGPRTSVKADFDRRSFGNSHSVTLSHRTPLTVWTASDSKSLQLGGPSGRGVTSYYDQFFAQFASTEPDPIKRDVLVRDFLTANGLDPAGKVIVGGFITGGPTLQRVQNLSSAYRGLRATITVSLVRTSTERAGTAAAVADDTANGRVRQQGITFSLTHRFTADSSIVVTASSQRTLAAGAQPANSLRSVLATWTAQLGRTASMSLGLRHQSFDSEVNPYHESAVIGSFRMRF